VEFKEGQKHHSRVIQISPVESSQWLRHFEFTPDAYWADIPPLDRFAHIWVRSEAPPASRPIRDAQLSRHVSQLTADMESLRKENEELKREISQWAAFRAPFQSGAQWQENSSMQETIQMLGDDLAQLQAELQNERGARQRQEQSTEFYQNKYQRLRDLLATSAPARDKPVPVKDDKIANAIIRLEKLSLKHENDRRAKSRPETLPRPLSPHENSLHLLPRPVGPSGDYE
jgi:hypothetical protein